MKLVPTIGAAFLALSLATSVPTLAQTSMSNARAAVMADHSLRTSKLVGSPVYNANGEEIGTIDDVLVDPSGGAPRAILSVGHYIGTGNRLVAVPLSSVQLGSGKMVMPNATKDTLGKMPAFAYQNANTGGGAG